MAKFRKRDKALLRREGGGGRGGRLLERVRFSKILIKYNFIFALNIPSAFSHQCNTNSACIDYHIQVLIKQKVYYDVLIYLTTLSMCSIYIR